MGKITYLVMALIFVIGVTIGSSTHVIAQQTSIPSWVKKTAGWWSQGQVSDAEFIKAIQWMIDNGLIHISSSQTSSSTGTPPPTTQTVQDTIKSITGEEPKLLGNVYVVYLFWIPSLHSGTLSPPGDSYAGLGPDLTIYGEPSDAAALSDYQKFLTPRTINQAIVTTAWVSPVNNNAQCSIQILTSSESGNPSITYNSITALCDEGKFLFLINSDGSTGNELTNAKNFANSIVGKIPNNGE